MTSCLMYMDVVYIMGVNFLRSIIDFLNVVISEQSFQIKKFSVDSVMRKTDWKREIMLCIN